MRFPSLPRGGTSFSEGSSRAVLVTRGLPPAAGNLPQRLANAGIEHPIVPSAMQGGERFLGLFLRHPLRGNQLRRIGKPLPEAGCRLNRGSATGLIWKLFARTPHVHGAFTALD
jgi:hypothetical protein